MGKACWSFCASSAQAPEALGFKRGREGEGVFPSGDQHTAWQGPPRLHTPAFHSYLVTAALLPTDLIITLCTFKKIYGFELLLLVTFVILKL